MSEADDVDALSEIEFLDQAPRSGQRRTGSARDRQVRVGPAQPRECQDGVVVALVRRKLGDHEEQRGVQSESQLRPYGRDVGPGDILLTEALGVEADPGMKCKCGGSTIPSESRRCVIARLITTNSFVHQPRSSPPLEKRR